ncbi:MAG: hypothetical protein WBX27_08340 [Specibacter sp.]
MRVPIRPLAGRWPRVLQNRFARFFWADPQAILRPDAPPEDFRAAMSAIEVGGTYKITGSNRHPGADKLVAEHLDLTGGVIVDIGASDGSTSLDFLSTLNGFASYVIADLYLYVRAVERRGRSYFFDPGGQWILVAGSRFTAWPAGSRLVRWLFGRGARAAAHEPGRDVLLLNPAMRDRMAQDPRVTAVVHDVFTPWPGPPPDLIKVANLLRRLYFDDATILAGLEVLHESLPDGGHLLIVDNPRIAGMPPRCGLYRRTGDGFAVTAQSPDVPEIADLIPHVRGRR